MRNDREADGGCSMKKNSGEFVRQQAQVVSVSTIFFNLKTKQKLS